MKQRDLIFKHNRVFYQGKTKKRSKVKKIIWLIILGLVILSVFVFGWYRWQLSAVNPVDLARSEVVIEPGGTVTSIAGQLKEKGLIRSALAFSLYARFNNLQGNLQAGTFLLHPAMNLEEIMQALQNAEAQEFAVTIPEGYTIDAIDAVLRREGLIKRGELIACAQRCDFSTYTFLPDVSGLAERGGKVEGYLFPDTYFVTATDFVPKFFLERMLNTFRNRVLTELGQQIEGSERNLHEIITMASLVEEESRHAAERSVIAGILWKRLDAGMRLDVDATVRYFLNKPSDEITREDLLQQHPYNTRRVAGLPPGPIASPGLDSIKATLNPEDSPYYFYLHDSKGLVYYARTNEEHNENKRKYLR